LSRTIPGHRERRMPTSDDSCDRPCTRAICRRDFLKLAVATGFLAGCSTSREQAATPISEPTAPPTIAPAPESTEVSSDSAGDFSQVAYCGIRCQEACPEYEYPISCDGCKSAGTKLGSYCGECTIRECAGERQVATCAHCSEYPSCDAEEWTKFPLLKTRIDLIRDEL
jgi:hypothetical protein